MADKESKSSPAFTEENETEWKEFNKHPKTIKADQLRLSVLASATNIRKSLEKLPRVELKASHARRFHLIKTEVDDVIAKAKINNTKFVDSILEQDRSVLDNPLYEIDQERFRNSLDLLTDEVEKYIDILDAIEG